MKPFFRKLALAGAMAAVFATPAMAAVSASASISNFTVSLFDLNPTDGIAATLTWTDPYGYNTQYGSYTQAYTYDSVNGYGSNGYATNYASLGAVNTSSASLSHATATANVAASTVALTPSGNLSASGSAYATTTSGNTSFNAYAYEPYYYYSSFTLSSNTLAVFTATANTQATTTVGYDWVSGQSESANASVSFSISGTGASGNGSQSSNDSNTSYASSIYGGYTYDPETGGYQYNYLPQSTSSSATLAGSFVNTSTGDLTGQMYMNVQAYGSTNVMAVPEPESYAMFLAGLGVMGAVARRRKQK